MTEFVKKYTLQRILFLTISFISSITQLKAQSPTAEPIEIPLYMTIESIYTYEIKCQLDPLTGDLLGIESEEMKEILSHWIDENIYPAWEDLFMNAYLSPQALRQKKVTINFDRSLLEVQISIPYALQKARKIDLSGKNTQGHSLNQAIKPQGFSSYINIWGYHKYNQSPELESWSNSFTLEEVLNLQQWILTARTNWNNTEDWSDNRVTLEHDFASISSRLAMGHYTVNSQGFQASGLYQGLSVHYRPQINNRNIRNSSIRKSFILEKKAHIEVWINQRKVKEMELPPGKYDLREFPFYSGLNLIELIIQEEGQNIRRLEFNQSYNARLLSRGEQDFQYSLGTVPWEWESMVLSGNHSLGLSDTLNLGLNYQWLDRQHLGGIECTWASPLGIITWDSALQWDKSFLYRGLGAQASYQLILNSRRYAPKVGWNVKYQSEGFQEETNHLSRQWSGALFIKQPLLKAGTLGFNLGFQNYRDSIESRWDLSTRLNIPLSDSADFFLNFKTDPTEPALNNSSLQVQLHLKDLKRHRTVNYLQDVMLQESKLDWQQNLPSQNTQISGGFTLNSLESGASWNGQTGTSYQNHRIQSSLNLNGSGGSGSLSQWSGTLQYGTALVFTGGAFSVASPVYDSFAIIQPRYQLSGRNLGINPSGGYESRSGLLGPAVISNLYAYHPKNIQVELLDFQAEDILLMDQTQFLLYPTRKSGIILRVGKPPVRTLKWVVKDSQGEPLPYMTGILDDGSQEIWFFTDQLGEAYAYGIQSEVVTLKISGYTPVILNEFEMEDHFWNAGEVILPAAEEGNK